MARHFPVGKNSDGGDWPRRRCLAADVPSRYQRMRAPITKAFTWTLLLPA